MAHPALETQNWLKLTNWEKSALVARLVMDLEENEIWGNMGLNFNGKPMLVLDCPNYVEDISAAWEVLSEFSNSQIRISNKALQSEYWWVTIDEVIAQGSTLPEAICWAACLKKVYDKESENGKES